MRQILRDVGYVSYPKPARRRGTRITLPNGVVLEQLEHQL